MHRSYRQQDGCHNCPHVFKVVEYESDSMWYCKWNRPKRPMCGSVAMKECWNTLKPKQFSKQMAEWDEWTKNNEVDSWGICLHHPSLLEDT